MNKRALFYKKEEDKIRCNLCPHNCLISEGHRGICNVRKAMKDEDGELNLYSLNYGEVTSISLDPIIKKPLYKFYPESMILSIGSFGCNFKCSFCQNYDISQYRPKSKFISPEEMAKISLDMEESIGLAFTYNEPSIWYEYVYYTAKKIKEIDSNHKVVVVTNGYISEEPLKALLPYVDALNIDLKGNNEYYKKLCFGSLEEVKRTIKIAVEMGKHVEVTILLIPDENTDNFTLADIGNFLNKLDRTIPLHISRYFPRYKMDKNATSLQEMRNAYKVLSEKLDNIYLGNLTKAEIEYCMS